MVITSTPLNNDQRYDAFIRWCQYQNKLQGISLQKLVKSKAIYRWFSRLLDLNRPLLIQELQQCGIEQAWELEFITTHWEKNLTFFYPKALLKNLNKNLN